MNYFRSFLQFSTVSGAVCGLILTSTLVSDAREITPATTISPLVSIKEVMENTITPATNTLWNAFNPPKSDEEWQNLEDAAVTLLVASNVVNIGGSGPMDNAWTKSSAWTDFNLKMISAAQDALTAIRNRDHDALVAASDLLYPPCEGCHLQFNPGVIGQ